jgi:AcrR family transcriptional regulator
MKISKEQKQNNQEKLFAATVKLSRKGGFRSVTMKSIAKEAGLGEATIYNYFPTKEQIIFGYFSWTLRKSIESLNEKEMLQMSFSEKLHALMEAHLDFISKDKSFVEDVFSQVFINPIVLSKTELRESKQMHMHFTRQALETAVVKNQIQRPPFEDFILELIWDFHVGMIYYWIRDNSAHYMNTTHLIDMSLQVFQQVLAGDLIGKIYGLSHFLLKEHLLGKLFDTREPNV